MDDDELIARTAGGDDTALRELFSRHAPWLAARLRTKLPAADVEDVLQETFLAVWRAAAAYRPQEQGSGGGWLWGIARRQAAMWLRRQGRNDAVFLYSPITSDAPPGTDPPSAQDAEAAAIARTDLAAAVASLGPPGGPEREVWQLLYVEDRPVAQVAEMLGVPEGTVKSRGHRARRLLKAALLGRPAQQQSAQHRSGEGGAESL
ncbi:MAG TPA: RNA polymerase sigma factor [Actinocrinis sp.]|jgi:RNA polymerase sigma-70 factor (ECF subfamily)